ncbi:MAG TPA: molybdopterin cofactor-binding domain-containing protein [Rhizomicrobium sp.]
MTKPEITNAADAARISSNAGSADVSRRGLLKAGVAGAFLVGFHVPRAQADGAVFAPNAFIRIGADNIVTLIMPQVEMGQGIYTSIAMILAEELDADFAKVVLEHAPPDDKTYRNPIIGIQVTGNSNSIRAFWSPLRQAAANTRATLVAVAAKAWNILPEKCRTTGGQIIHDESGRRVAYGALVGEAHAYPPVSDAPLKELKNFTLIGRPLKRLDTRDKINGKTRFGIDVMPPGVKIATLAASPVFGGKVRHVDESKAKLVPGVRQIVVLDDLVAVVGDHMWAAKKGLDALDISWDPGPNATLDSQAIWDDLRRASESKGVVARHAGNADDALRDGDMLEAAYELPFLAHAPLEPINCTVHMTPGACEIWLGTQVMGRMQARAAKVTGLPPEKITVHQHMLGGSFGRRLEGDMVVKAVRIAQHVEGPVKVIWTREEDIQQGVYRPVYRNLLAASLKDGHLNGWTHRVTAAAVMARIRPSGFQHGVDSDAVDSAINMPYEIPNLRLEYVRSEPQAIPTGFWRGVGNNNNVFAIESFIDEIAHKAGKDPVQFRLGLLDKTPRLKAVIELAARKAGWGDTLPARTGRGIAAQVSYDSFVATICEAEVDRGGNVKLRRIVSAVDTGIVINPDTIAAQLQGGLIFGLTAALFGEITITGGRVAQSNFHDYRMLRINEVPNIEVHHIKSADAPGGIGETGVQAGPPALCNALYAATGVRLRRLPIDRPMLAESKSV